MSRLVGSKGCWEQGLYLSQGVFGFVEILFKLFFLFDVLFFFLNERVELVKVLKKIFLDLFEGSFTFLIELSFLFVLWDLVDVIGIELTFVVFVVLEGSFQGFGLDLEGFFVGLEHRWEVIQKKIIRKFEFPEFIIPKFTLILIFCSDLFLYANLYSLLIKKLNIVNW